MMKRTGTLFSRIASIFRNPALAMGQGPWGGGKGGDEGEGEGDSSKGNSEGPRNPWTQPPRGGGRPEGGSGQSRPSLIDDLMRRGREGFGGRGGNGGGSGGMFPGGAEARALWPIALTVVLILWIALTSFHRIGPQERGVVLMLGKYSRTLMPGIGLTLPAPLETVEVVDVEEIRVINIGSISNNDENLMLTGDQNIIDLAYSVRWNISNPQLYKFQLADADTTISEVAESAMRSVVATVSLTDALGAGRTRIEQQVEQRMQEILDSYRAGVKVQGVAVKQADPPEAVNDAFKEVSAATQDATTYVNQATAYAQQLHARAQGEAAAFDKVYEQYRLAPEVTRRRMYYETMESVLSNVDKTIIETNGVTPYLPLPELKRRAKAPPASGASAQGEGQ